MKWKRAISAILLLAVASAVLGIALNLAMHKSGGEEGAEKPAPAQDIAEHEPSSKTYDINHEADNNEQKPEPKPERKQVTVAWQPSHQDDTGDASWHEYEVCNDIVERAMALSVEVNNVKCWDISHGLTGTNRYNPQPTNTPAFDVEIAAANQARADYFISVHNDGGAPSGILGLCMPGDSLSRTYLEQAVASLCASTGLPNRGIWEVRLYSLEPDKNSCPVRFILEIGDNVKDRDKLMDPGFRQLVARTLADFVNKLPPQR